MANTETAVAKSTAQNARNIDRKFKSASGNLQKAMEDLRDVILLMESGEKQPEYMTPEIRDLMGAVKVAKRGVLHTQMPWNGYAEARAAERG